MDYIYKKFEAKPGCPGDCNGLGLLFKRQFFYI